MAKAKTYADVIAINRDCYEYHKAAGFVAVSAQIPGYGSIYTCDGVIIYFLGDYPVPSVLHNMTEDAIVDRINSYCSIVNDYDPNRRIVKQIEKIAPAKTLARRHKQLLHLFSDDYNLYIQQRFVSDLPRRISYYIKDFPNPAVICMDDRGLPRPVRIVMPFNERGV